MSMATATPDVMSMETSTPDVMSMETAVSEPTDPPDTENLEDEGYRGEEDGEEDPVVHELDVYITKSLGKLVLAQYPLRPTYKPYQNVTRENLRLRPVQNELEVDMKIQNKPNVPQQVQKLVVTQRPLIKPNIGIGLVKGHELHLTPLESILQLTPSFEHIDKRLAEDAKLNEKKEDMPKVVQSVTRKFSKVESERDKAMRLESYENIQQERQKEMWVPCDYRPPEHPYTAGQKRAMIGKKGVSGIAGSELDKVAYLDVLLPEDRELEYKAPTLPCFVVGMSELKKLSHQKQVETVMRNAKLISFKQICGILSNVPKSKILSELQDIAYLVQGHWVISSEVLHPKDTKSRLTGAPAELMCRHRDLIMWAFTHTTVVKRENIMSFTKIHADEILDILKQVSVLRPREGWYFKLPHCTDIEEEYPDIQDAATAAWRKIFDDLFVSLHLKNHKTNPLLEYHRKEEVNELPILTLETATEIINKQDLENVVEPNILVDLSFEFQTMIGQITTPVEHMVEHMTQYIPYDQCRGVLEDMCAYLSISIICTLTQEEQKVELLAYNCVGQAADKFRHVIFSLFASKYQVSKAELKEAVQQELCCTMTNKDYQNITSSLCEPASSSRSGVWKLKILVAFKVT